MKITHKTGIVFEIQEEFPRYMRLFTEKVCPENIYGLMDLYSTLDLEGKIGVEIGSWTGESSEVATQVLGKLTCIDPWEAHDNRESVFDQRMLKFSNVTKLKTQSSIATSEFSPLSIDFIYIDGLHDYANVAQDITMWLPKIKVGGWITGHDYDDDPLHDGVAKAVNDLLGVPEFRFNDTSWAFRISSTLQNRFN